MKLANLVPGALLVLLASGNAVAANPRAILDIYDGNATQATWSEDVSGLLVADANGNFSLLNGSNSPYYQSGVGLQNSQPNTVTGHPDYWVWATDAATNKGYWSWQSADGTAVAELHGAWGLGDPKVDLEFTVKNNSANTRAYTFREGEDFTAINAPTVISAQFNAMVRNPTGSSTMTPVGNALQELYLYDKNGTSINAGAGLGVLPVTLDNAHNSFSAALSNVGGPAGAWNYMELVSKFTLSAHSDKIEVAGWASITPVPEADTYSMMLAGLGMIGFMVSRRKNQQA